MTRKYPPILGGMEQYSFDLYRAWAEREDVTLLENPEGNRALGRFFVKAAAFVLAHAAKYDLVYLGDGVLAALIPLIRARSAARVGVTVHGLDITYRRFGYQFLFPRLIAQADRVVCVSSRTRETCLERGVPKEKTRVIPNGIDFTRLPRNEQHTPESIGRKYGFDVTQKPVLFSVGRLITRKGHAWFIREYMPKLKDRFSLVIAGDGAERPAIEAARRELGLEGVVHLLGPVDDQEKAFWLEYARAYVMPNIRIENDPEGFGIAVLEATAFELPVFTTGVDGIADQMHYCYPLDALLEPALPERTGEEWAALREGMDWRRVISAYIDEV